MIETFFFIPADKIRFINKLPEIKASNFILDFEDSIKSSNLSVALKNITNIKNIENFWARPTLFNTNNDLDLNLIKNLIDLGIKKIIIPKIFNRSHLKAISEIKGIKKCEFILLIESAKAFNNVDKLLTFKKINIKGLVLGSHDFVSDLGMKYNVEDLKYFRQTLLIKAKAYHIKPIDIASMEIKNNLEFKEEVLSGFNMGYRAKMILHPSQLELLDEISFFNNDETLFARKVIKKYPNLSDEIEAVNFEGRILERPHIKRILEILRYDDR